MTTEEATSFCSKGAEVLGWIGTNSNMEDLKNKDFHERFHKLDVRINSSLQI